MILPELTAPSINYGKIGVALHEFVYGSYEKTPQRN